MLNHFEKVLIRTNKKEIITPPIKPHKGYLRILFDGTTEVKALSNIGL